MIVGTGMDLVTIQRFRGFRERRGERGLVRVFTESELQYCMSRVDPAPSLAARFAAKEAFFKAIGLGWGVGGGWLDVEVTRDDRGAPGLDLSGRAAETAMERGVIRSHLSLTHTDEVAGAVVVLESGGRGA
ncbi:MAG TPA: holo-ACP synthase [Longimicrobiales bacterium]|nr:holo-ACP synthase [Longimicrobiales bacterium]